MSTPTPRQLTRYMREQAEAHLDRGEVNCTALAEDAADHFDYYEGDDYTIPEVVFDVAAQAAEWYERTSQ